LKFFAHEPQKQHTFVLFRNNKQVKLCQANRNTAVKNFFFEFFFANPFVTAVLKENLRLSGKIGTAIEKLLKKVTFTGLRLNNVSVFDRRQI